MKEGKQLGRETMKNIWGTKTRNHAQACLSRASPTQCTAVCYCGTINTEKAPGRPLVLQLRTCYIPLSESESTSCEQDKGLPWSWMGKFMSWRGGFTTNLDFNKYLELAQWELPSILPRQVEGNQVCPWGKVVTYQDYLLKTRITDVYLGSSEKLLERLLQDDASQPAQHICLPQ